MNELANFRSDGGGLRELALFAGAGGGILGGHLLGWRTVCAVERDAFAAAVLAQRQNDGCLEPFPVWSDVETFDGRPWRGIVDIVSGGFPCTDISCAGKGAGIEGEESGLWREMWRIIGEVRPRFVLVENSPMLTIRGGVRVVGDLAALGYDARWGVVSAADAIWFECLSRDGVPALDHLRERMWIVAESTESEGVGSGTRRTQDRKPQRADRLGGVLPAPADREGNGGGTGLREDGPEQDGHQPTDGRGDDQAGADAIGNQLRFNPTKSEGRGEADRGAGENTDETSTDADRDNRSADGRESDAGTDGRHIATRLCAESTDAALGRLAVRWWPSRNAGYTGRVHEVGNAENERCEGLGADREQESRAHDGETVSMCPSQGPGWWAVEPDVGRLVHGLADRVDRCKALGNGQVPAVVRLAWNLLKPD